MQQARDPYFFYIIGMVMYGAPGGGCPSIYIDRGN